MVLKYSAIVPLEYSDRARSEFRPGANAARNEFQTARAFLSERAQMPPETSFRPRALFFREGANAARSELQTARAFFSDRARSEYSKGMVFKLLNSFLPEWY